MEIGRWWDTDRALGVNQSMTRKDVDSNECGDSVDYECSLCGRTFSTESGRQQHKYQYCITEGRLLRDLEEFVDELGEAPTRDQMSELGPHDSRVYERRFGGWGGALLEIGVTPKLRRNIDDDELLQSLERLADDLGRAPTQSDMSEEGPHTIDPYLDRWGSWNNALKEIGEEPNHEYLDETTLLSGIQEFADEIGKTPTSWEMEVEGPHSRSAYLRNFESWNMALQKAGFEPNRETHVSDETLAAELRAFALECSETPTREMVDIDGPHASTTYVNRFGSWEAALSAADVSTESSPEVDSEDLLAEISRLAETIGTTPSASDIVKSSRYPIDAYIHTFDSLKSAIREAGFTPLKEQSALTPVVTRYYGPNWPEQREAARERDSQQCRECGMTKEEHIQKNGRNLPVHHRVPFEEFRPIEPKEDYDEANRLENLLTLCVKHHWKWEGLPVQPPADL